MKKLEKLGNINGGAVGGTKCKLITSNAVQCADNPDTFYF